MDEIIDEYWFVSYNATGNDRETGGLMGNTVIDVLPSVWVQRLMANPEIKDGPYVILYAERIPKSVYLWFKEEL